MIDYFALLGEARRPWLDPAELKKKYQHLTFAEHPDRQPDHRRTEAAPAFAEINEAYRVLTNPRLRLQHLLRLQGKTRDRNQSPPADLMEFFSQIGRLLPDVDLLLGKVKTADNALAKSLLQAELVEKRNRCNDVLALLQESREASIQQIQAVDKIWDEQNSEVTGGLEKIYQRVSYLDRWIEQLREREFHLSN